MTTTNTTPKAAALLKAMTTRELIDAFILSDTNTDPNVYTVRGWLMDELERRNPEAFDAWMESDDCLEGSKSLLKYYPC